MSPALNRSSQNNQLHVAPPTKLCHRHYGTHSCVLRILSWSFRSTSGSMYGLSSSSSYPMFIHLSFIITWREEDQPYKLKGRYIQMYHSFSYFPLLPPPLNFISSLFLFPPFPSSLAPSLSFLSPHPPHYLSPTIPPPSLSQPHHQSQGATQLGSLTSKLALFAGFSTRNFFNKFSQSAVKEQTQHSHWTHTSGHQNSRVDAL